MPKQEVKKGFTSLTVLVFIQDTTSTTGAGLTGLVYNSGSLIAYYARPRAASVAITLATQTVTGAYSSGGFVEIDATHMPGWYRLDVPDACLASGVGTVGIHLQGAANMAPLTLEISLADTGAIHIVKNTAFAAFPFLMVDAADHVTAKTGLSVASTRMIDNAGSFSACANSASEIGNGIYVIDLEATDVNGNVITFRFTGSGADDRFVTVFTQPA